MKLHFKKYGSRGKVLIILHGLFGSLNNWHTIAKELSQYCIVYTLDLRNHGKSPHNEEFSYQEMADDVEEFLQDQGLTMVNIAGHSLGGKIAMQFAITYPERVTKLIVIDASPLDYVDLPMDVLNIMLRFDLSLIGSRDDADRLLTSKIPDAKVRQFLLGNLERNSKGGFRWRVNLPAIRDNFEDILQPISSESIFGKPVLFIKGGKSDYIKGESFALIKETFPQAVLSIIPEAGHWVHVDARRELIDKLVRFIK